MSLTITNTAREILLVCSYALEDAAFWKELHKHLLPLQQRGLSMWGMRDVPVGHARAAMLPAALDRADLILLLLSPDFLASFECFHVEMRLAMERSAEGNARVLPVLVRPVDLSEVPAGALRPLPENARPVTLWPNRDAAFLNIARGVKRVVEELTARARGTSLAQETLPDENSTPPQPRWSVPYRRNPLFTGRETILHALQERFAAQDANVLALCGLGGMGKTQVALEYAYRTQQNYQATFWLRADTPTTLAAECRAWFSLLNLPEKAIEQQEEILAALKRWLQREQHWLLILDNVEDLALVEMILPSTYQGHVLLTTRAQATGTLAQAIALPPLTTAEGVALLLTRAKLATTAETPTQEQREQARAIVQAMGGLPLALDQAGAYLEETRAGLAEYLHLYRRRRAALLKRRGRFATDHPTPVATTLQLSIERVGQLHPAAVDLLRLCAFLHPDAIPESLFHAEGDQKDEQERERAFLFSDSYERDIAIETLLLFSFIGRNPTTQILSIHRLVQAVLIDQLSEEEQRQWAEQALLLVERAFSEGSMVHWQRSDALVPHAQVCAEAIERWQLTSRETVRLLLTLGEYQRRRAVYPEAETLLKRALQIAQEVLGEQNLETARAYNELGRLFQNLAHYVEAEPLLLRALAIRQQLAGEQTLPAAESLNYLGKLYHSQDKFAQAEPLLEEALHIRKSLLGPDHFIVSDSLTSLAEFYRSQENYAQAELLHQQALDIRLRLFGEDHPETAQIMNALGVCYGKQRKDELAEPLYRQALAVRLRVFGDHNPTVAQGYNNLANFLKRRGAYQEAEELYQQALAVYQAFFRENHPRTAIVHSNLADLYEQQGNYEEAEQHYQHALTAYRNVFGEQHSKTANAQQNLARVKDYQRLHASLEEAPENRDN
jgi:tetratricopeptide (TPR) repeat protein